MRYSIYINAVKCQEWGLNLSQGVLFDLLNQASSWAKHYIVDGELFFWVSRHMVIQEIPLAYSKPDTVYRAFKDLADKGLIIYIKQGQKDLIQLTEKGKQWNARNSEINPNVGNKSEQNSEINPTFCSKLGNKSEQNSEINPTDHNTNNPNTNNHSTSEKNARAKFTKPTFEQVKDYFKERGQVDYELQAQRFLNHFDSNGWLVGGKSPMKDWKAAVRNWMLNNFPKSQGQHHANYRPNHPEFDTATTAGYAAKLQHDLAKLTGQPTQSATTGGNWTDVYPVEGMV